MLPENDLFELHARICSTLANPRRLMIINALRNGETAVNEIAEAIGVPQATVSRHLALMRNQGVLSARRNGQNVYYQITNSKIITAYELMHEVTLEYLESGTTLHRLVLERE